MKTVLIYRNHPRLLVPNPNLAFIRNFADNNAEKIKDPKAVANQILQNSLLNVNKEEESRRRLPEDSHKTAEQIITDYPEEPTTCCMSGCANCVWLDYAEKISAYYKDGGERAIKEINARVNDSNIKAFLLHELRMAAKKD